MRSGSSWKTIIQDALDWVNTKSHVSRVISISIVLAHNTNSGVTIIYYDDSQTP